MTVSSSTTDKPMSNDSSMSSTSGGIGTIISSTTAITAAGARSCVARFGGEIVGVLIQLTLTAEDAASKPSAAVSRRNGRPASSSLPAVPAPLVRLEHQLLNANQVREHF